MRFNLWYGIVFYEFKLTGLCLSTTTHYRGPDHVLNENIPPYISLTTNAFICFEIFITVHRQDKLLNLKN